MQFLTIFRKVRRSTLSSSVICIVQSVIQFAKEGNDGDKKKNVQWWITFVSQFIGAFSTILSALMFICCTAITICTKVRFTAW